MMEEAVGPALAIAVLLPVATVAASLLAALPLLNWVIRYVEVAPGHVVVGYLHKKVRIDREDVRMVRMGFPPGVSLRDPKWLKSSGGSFSIEIRGGRRIVLTYIPNEVKLRMTRVLDPDRYPMPEGGT